MEVYKIGVSIALTNNLSSALAVLGRQFTGLHTTVRGIENSFGRWSVAIGGVASLMAGGAILGAMVKLVDKTKEYSAELVKIERLGGEMGKMVRSGAFEKKSFDMARKSGLNVVDAMKIPGDTYSILGAESSMEMWQNLARYSFMQRQSGDTKGNGKDDLNKLIRAAEMTGRLTDPVTSHAGIKQLEHFLDMMAKVGAATHGMVNADTLLGLGKQGGFTLRGLNDEGMFNTLIMAQAMGGNRAGTSILSLWAQMGGGTMLKRSAQGLQDLGLLKEGEWTTGKGGQVQITDEASKRLHGLISKDPMDLARVLRQQFEKQGVTDPEEQMRRIVRAFGRQTTQRFTAEEVMNYKQMEEERGRIQGGMNAGDSWKLYMDKSVPANMAALSNAWETLLNAVAGPQAQGSIGVMKELTKHINDMTDFVRGLDPGTITGIAKGLAAFAAAMIALGTVSLVVVAGIPGAIAAAVAALATFVVLNWEGLKKGVDSVVTAMNSFLTGLDDMTRGIWEWVKSLPGKIKEFLTTPLFGSPKKEPTSGEGGEWGTLLKKANFQPNDIKVRAAPITLALNLDGRTLAQAISQEIDYLHEHPTSAPSYDTASRFGPADGGMISS